MRGSSRHSEKEWWGSTRELERSVASILPVDVIFKKAVKAYFSNAFTF